MKDNHFSLPLTSSALSSQAPSQARWIATEE